MTGGRPGRGAPGDRPARLGYLLSQYPSANHTYLLREVRALRESGIDVRVVAIDGDTRGLGGVTAPEVEERATTYVVKACTVTQVVAAHAATAFTRPQKYAAGLAASLRLAGFDAKRVLYHLFYFGEAVIAGRRLWADGCTHVHTHYATTVAVIAARVFPFEISATIHGPAEFTDPVAQRLREKIAACAFVRAISMYGQSQLMLASPVQQWAKFVVVRLGVDPDAFTPAPLRAHPTPFRITSIGRLAAVKGFPVLLRALASLVRDGRDIVLTLVGGGEDKELLQAYAAELGIAERVVFTGMLNQTGVQAVLHETDVFVLASFAEGIPVVLMEAMAMELPCVATGINGIPELIHDRCDGLLVAPSDHGALSGAIARLMDDPDERRRLGIEARQRVTREYDLDTNTASLRAVLVRSLGGRSRPETRASAE